MSSIVSRFANRCVLAVCVALGASGAHAVDSTDIAPASPVTVSNCPNINDNWYASGVVPAGYYKSTGVAGHTAGYCYPVSSCPSGQAWNQAAETCESTTPTCPAGTVYVASTGTCVTASEAAGMDRCTNNLGTWNSALQSCMHDMYMYGLYNYSVSCSECGFDANQTGSAIHAWTNVRVRASYSGQTDVLDMSGRGRTDLKAGSQEFFNFGVLFGNGYRARLADGQNLANMALALPNAATTTWLRSVGCVVRPWSNGETVLVNGTTGYPWFNDTASYPVWGTRYLDNPTGGAPANYFNALVLMCRPGSSNPAWLG